jgi:hypothetical protein
MLLLENKVGVKLTHAGVDGDHDAPADRASCHHVSKNGADRFF